MKGWWTVRVTKGKKAPYRMFACPWVYLIVSKSGFEVGKF